MMMDHGQEAIDIVQGVRDAGMNVAIDDFGSGMSSLSLVKDINASELKIDRSLLSDNCESEKERIVLESIFQFAQRLGIRTVAEGVETKQQLAFLRTCGCDLVQGFFFAKPLPEDEFVRILDEDVEMSFAEDILVAQSAAGATQLLLQAVFTRFPLVIFGNITRNSYYMMAYEHFTSTECPSTGVFDEFIEHGASTMEESDQAAFSHVFSRENLRRAYKEGQKSVRLVTRQRGDDGVYRPVETVDYFVTSSSSDDILIVSLCQNVEE